jgi:hypothetical protein
MVIISALCGVLITFRVTVALALYCIFKAFCVVIIAVTYYMPVCTVYISVETFVVIADVFTYAAA